MKNIEKINEELLKYAITEGIIDISSVKKQIDMAKKNELLAKHQYMIWQGNDKQWRTYLPDEEKGRRLVKRTSKESIEESIIDHYQQQLDNPIVDDVFSEWNDRRLDLKKISNATHLRNKQFYNRHYVSMGKRRIKSISQDEWGDFLEEQISEHNLTAKAFAGLKGITKGLLKRARKRKLIDYNVEEIFDNLDVSEKEFQKVIKEDYEEVFDEEETYKMIEYLKNNLDSANIAILLMFVTGARIGEIVTLKHNDFDGNTFKIRRTETRYRNADNKYVLEVKDFPKTQAGVRTVIIPRDYEWICTKVKLLNPFSEYIFLSQTTGKRLSTQAVRMRLDKLCNKLHIYHKSPHKIRKTYGSILLDNHIDNRLIMGQMGHTDIICTENHYHRNRRSIEKKTEILSSIPDLQVRHDY